MFKITKNYNLNIALILYSLLSKVLFTMLIKLNVSLYKTNNFNKTYYNSQL